MEFDWDEHNLFHIAMHGMRWESALRGGTIFIKAESGNGEERSSRVGQAHNGRILFIVTTPRGKQTRVVTAFGRTNSFVRHISPGKAERKHG